MPCGADRAILARVTAVIVAQICVMCYYKILSGNKALSKERKRHGCFEGADGDHRCGDVRFSVMDGEQLAFDCGHPRKVRSTRSAYRAPDREPKSGTAPVPRAVVRGLVFCGVLFCIFSLFVGFSNWLFTGGDTLTVLFELLFVSEAELYWSSGEVECFTNLAL